MAEASAGGVAERLPCAFQLHRLVDLAAEAEAGFLAGFTDRGDRERTRAGCHDLRATLEQVGFKFFGDRSGNGNAVI